MQLADCPAISFVFVCWHRNPKCKSVQLGDQLLFYLPGHCIPSAHLITRRKLCNMFPTFVFFSCKVKCGRTNSGRKQTVKCSPPSHKDCSLQQIFVVILPKSAFSCALHWAAKALPVSFKNLGVLEVDKYNSVVNINFFLERSNPARKPMNQLLCEFISSGSPQKSVVCGS